MQAKEFSNADEIFAHYRNLKKRFEAQNVRRVPEVSRPRLVYSQEMIAKIEAEKAEAAPPYFTKIKARAIVLDVCEKHHVPVEAVMGKGRKYNLTAARQEAMARIRCELNWSLCKIGQYFKRDHTTVLHGIQKHLGGKAAAE